VINSIYETYKITHYVKYI